MADNLPQSRALATGSVRFWYDAWHDLAQLGGGSEQGLINQTENLAYLRIMMEERAEPAIQWMQSYGVDAVIVHDEKSRECYHDFTHPRKFAGVLPVIYDRGEGDVIYKTPRRFPGLGRVVETARVASLPQATDANMAGVVSAYADAVEKGPDAPAETRWEGTEAMRVHAQIAAGQSLLVMVAYDPAWHAYSAGQSLTIRRDAMGQMLIAVPQGTHDIRLAFELPLENRIGRMMSLCCGLIILALLAAPLWRRWPLHSASSR
jgi:hypothetical protein